MSFKKSPFTHPKIQIKTKWFHVKNDSLDVRKYHPLSVTHARITGCNCLHGKSRSGSQSTPRYGLNRSQSRSGSVFHAVKIIRIAIRISSDPDRDPDIFVPCKRGIRGSTVKCSMFREERKTPTRTLPKCFSCLQDTFNYNSHFWLDKETYQVPQGLNVLTQEESKMASYWNTPFTKICLGMKVNGATKWVKMNYQASSLHNVIADGVFQPTSFGRATWLSLIDGSGLQQNCNEEGFNVDLSIKMRLGVAGNDQNDCNTCDSFIGFGNYWKNELRACGAQNKNAFGYILVQ